MHEKTKEFIVISIVFTLLVAGITAIGFICGYQYDKSNLCGQLGGRLVIMDGHTRWTAECVKVNEIRQCYYIHSDMQYCDNLSSNFNLKMR